MTWPDACFTNDTATGLAQATNKGMQKRLWRQLLTTTCLELVERDELRPSIKAQRNECGGKESRSVPSCVPSSVEISQRGNHQRHRIWQSPVSALWRDQSIDLVGKRPAYKDFKG